MCAKTRRKVFIVATAEWEALSKEEQDAIWEAVEQENQLAIKMAQESATPGTPLVMTREELADNYHSPEYFEEAGIQSLESMGMSELDVLVDWGVDENGYVIEDEED